MSLKIITGIVLLIFVFWAFFSLRFQSDRYINSRGYVVLVETNELEHRQIAKQLLGRDLAPNEIVHHINGKKTDNQIRNLCLMDSENHELFHSWLRWKKAKSGKYPSFRDQKRVLKEKYGGSLLENLKPQESVKCCPNCNSLMVLRMAKKGSNIGKQFWGCSRFPKCKGSFAA